MEKAQKKRMILFCLMCALVYFTSYMTRKGFNASIPAIVSSTGISRQAVGLAITVSFITYGIGQVLCGIMGDRIRPRYMIFIGLFGASVCNVLIPAFQSAVAYAVIWGINGFFQSMIWPPLVRAMSENFSLSFYNKGSSVVLIGSQIATAAIFILVSCCVKYLSWTSTCYIVCLLGVFVACLWFYVDGKYEKNPSFTPEVKDTALPTEKTEKKMSFGKLLIVSGAIPLMFTTVLVGFLRDGIETWMSSFIEEVYSVSTSGAIFFVAVLPALGIASYYFASFMQKITRGVVSACTATWAVACAVAILLAFFYKNSLLLGIAGFALLNAASHSVNMLVTSRTVIYFRKTGSVSTISGLLNACIYIGSAIATYGIADLSESTSWTVILLIFAAITVVGSAVSALTIHRWNCFAKTIEKE